MTALTGLPIAITGASSGIGAATAVACAAAGMPVALFARRGERLNEIADQIRTAGGNAVAVVGDVTNPDDCRRLVDQAVAEFGSLYAIFANAGYGEEIASMDMPDDRLRQMFEVNFFGTMNSLRPAIEWMRSNPAPSANATGPAARGHALICSSCLSKLGVPLYGAYCATKAAQDHVGRALRAELRREGIAVSTVHPVRTATEFADERVRRSGPSKVIDKPDRHLQTPETVANATLRQLRSGRGGEVWTSTPVRLGFALATALPNLTDHVLFKRLTRS